MSSTADKGLLPSTVAWLRKLIKELVMNEMLSFDSKDEASRSLINLRKVQLSAFSFSSPQINFSSPERSVFLPGLIFKKVLTLKNSFPISLEKGPQFFKINLCYRLQEKEGSFGYWQCCFLPPAKRSFM
jgi:hypothetical protein